VTAFFHSKFDGKFNGGTHGELGAPRLKVGAKGPTILHRS